MATSAAYIDLTEAAAPATPAAGKARVYAKADGLLYSKDDAGAESLVSGGGADGAWTSFTPTWTASANPAIGNGVLTGRYKALGTKTYAVVISVTWGSTTTAGTGAWSFGNLPFTSKSTAPAYQCVGAYIKDTGTASFAAVARLPAGSTGFDAVTVADATGTRHAAPAVPITWATGDEIVLQGVVESD